MSWKMKYNSSPVDDQVVPDFDNAHHHSHHHAHHHHNDHSSPHAYLPRRMFGTSTYSSPQPSSNQSSPHSHHYAHHPSLSSISQQSSPTSSAISSPYSPASSASSSPFSSHNSFCVPKSRPPGPLEMNDFWEEKYTRFVITSGKLGAKY